MNHEFFYPYDKSKLWTRNFILLSIANFLLYASTYILLPAVPLWMMQHAMGNYVEIGGTMALFAVGVFLLGVFNSYLIDRFKRKNICLLSIICLITTTYIYPQTESFIQIGVLRILQGVFFGITTMTLGSTLVFDISASHRRNQAGIVFAWMGRLGMAVGLAAGVFLTSFLDFRTLIAVCMICMMVVFFLILFVQVAFRAPLEPSLVSLDRFLLPRAMYPSLCMMLLVTIFGILVARIYTPFFYLSLLGGMVLAQAVNYWIMRHSYGKAEMELGIGSLMGGLLLIISFDTLVLSCLSSILMGLGLGLCASHFYRILITIPRHCERGTGNNTYQLMWEAGVMLGFCFDSVTGGTGNDVFFISLCFCALIILIYELSLHKWYNKQLENNQY